LWCIYYDPLLCHLQKLELGYEVSGQKIIDIYNNKVEKNSVNIPCMAYMDDTTIITNNKHNIEKMLKHVNEFNILNDIQINKEKSELLLRKINKNKVKKTRNRIVADFL
jgi:hypothetical protein